MDRRTQPAPHPVMTFDQLTFDRLHSSGETSLGAFAGQVVEPKTWHLKTMAPTPCALRPAARQAARPASIASVFLPVPVDSRSRTIAACRRGRSRLSRISDNRLRSRQG